MPETAIKAFWIGMLSAASLPLGSIIGILFKPKPKILSSIMAFGAGALLSALSFELVFEAFEKAGFYPLAIGAIIGGLTFDLLNKLINERGAFLRKSATISKFLFTLKRKKILKMFDKLSKIPVFLALPPEEINTIISKIKEVRFHKGSKIFKQRDAGDALYFIKSGEIEITRKEQDEEIEIATLKENELFGEMALLTGEERSADAVVKSNTVLWKISKYDFDNLLIQYPSLQKRFDKFLKERVNGLEDKKIIPEEEGEKWVEEAIHNIDTKFFLPSGDEVKELAKEKQHFGVAFAIWLGIFLDGIPESLVIGASMIGKAVSISLIAGLFLSNLPESMSSAVIMKKQGISINRIIWMWVSLMVITGIGAFLGNIFFINASHFTHALFGGMAAGAMLCMIAETMLPEAYEQGGATVGISTLLGFLSVIFCRSLQH